MRKYFFILNFFLWPLALHAATGFEGMYFQDGCSLYRYEGGFVKNFPGGRCLFLEDGSIVSSSESFLRFFNADNTIRWEITGNFHHQLNLSEDGQRILTLGSEFIKDPSGYLRYDTFLVISLEGKILAQNSIRNFKAEFIEEHYHEGFRKFIGAPGKEKSHFNSIFEIGGLDQNVKSPFLRKGYIIANSIGMGIYIFSSDMKTLVHHFFLAGDSTHEVHDVKVLPNGNFLLFNNTATPSGSRMHASALQEISYRTLRPVLSFSPTTDVPVLSVHCGGAQMVDKDHYLISHMYSGAYLFSKKTGKVIRSMTEPSLMNGRLWPVQNLRLIHISEKFKKLRL